MASKANPNELDGGVKPGGSQFTETPGGVITPVEGFFSDAGLGKPPMGAKVYGAVAEAHISKDAGRDTTSADGKAIRAFFGTKSPGGKK